VSRPGEMLSAAGLRPGPEEAGPSGSTEVVNQTGTSLAVGVTAHAPEGPLDDLLWLDVRAGDDVLFRGPLRDLRAGSARATLVPREERVLTVRTWLPSRATAGYEHRAVDIALTLDSDRAEA
jgi:hypothetical protein